MKAEKNSLDSKVIELEARIEELKIDYAHLVAKAENIKGDMKTVKEKVDRSI
jgi:molecular chaperone GrpE (heat shock protein)